MCLDGIHSCSSEGRWKFVLNLNPSTDTMLQSAHLCILKYYIIYSKHFIFLRFSSYMIRGGEAPKSLFRVWCHRSRKIQSSCILSLLCMCGGIVSVVWIRLLQHTLLFFPVTFFMYLFFLFYIFIAY